MYNLKHIDGTDLTEYTVQLLQKADITTVCEFLKTDVTKLIKIVHLPQTAIINLKQEVLQRYGPQRENLQQSYESILASSSTRIYQTGIGPLDTMLATVPFGAGCVWEICGLPAMGKTQLAHSVALNFASMHSRDVLYVDTKCDFSGTLIRQMLREHAVDKVECGRIMQRIKVERVFDAEALIAKLDQFESCYYANSSIRVVIIDSLPSLWLQLLTDEDKLRGRALLTKLANLIYKLATKHSVAFLLVNLSVLVKDKPNLQSHGDSDPNESDLDQNDYEEPRSRTATNKVYERPVLGYYWRSVPHIRLSIAIPEQLDDQYSRRVVKVLKSCYSQTGDFCYVHITDAGVF